jgi:hypothetical protein
VGAVIAVTSSEAAAALEGSADGEFADRLARGRDLTGAEVVGQRIAARLPTATAHSDSYSSLRTPRIAQARSGWMPPIAWATSPSFWA